MGVNTLVKEGVVYDIGADIKIVPLNLKNGDVHYNPGLARDDKGNTWVSIRSCIRNIEKFKGYLHPMSYQNFLHVGKFNEETFEITDIKEIKPVDKIEALHWGIEDIRLFWRNDGLHGIGVILPIKKNGPLANEAEILIDYGKGTYKIINDFGHPRGHAEKNWMPPETPSELFDFTYSPTEVVKNGEIITYEQNDLFLHNGTPLIPYENGYLSIMHMVCSIQNERTYANVAVEWNKEGRITHTSQMFHFNVGWREQLKETIEFASALLWSKPNEEILVGLGVKDEVAGFCKIPISKFKWQPYEDTLYYGWKWNEVPNRIELETPKPDPAYPHVAQPRQQVASPKSVAEFL